MEAEDKWKDVIWFEEGGVRYTMKQLEEMYAKLVAGNGSEADGSTPDDPETSPPPAGPSSPASSDPPEVDHWVQCSKKNCQKWRKLRNGVDVDKLPEVWTCVMNPDRKFNRCKVPSELVEGDFDRYDVVWVRFRQKWFPAMVDVCPDYKNWVWYDDGSVKPDQYNVVFFDEPVSRAWIRTRFIVKFTLEGGPPNEPKDPAKLLELVKIADKALGMKREDRGKAFSFVARFKGPIKKTKKKK